MQISPLVLAPLLTLVTAAGLALHTGRRGVQGSTDRIYLALLASLMIAAITALGMLADRTANDPQFSLQVNGLLFLSALLLGNKFLLHLVVARAEEGRSRERVSFHYFLPLYLSAGGILVLLWLTPLLVTGFVQQGAFFVPAKGPWFEFLLYYLIGSQLISLGFLVQGSRHAASTLVQRRNALLAIGLLAPLAGLMAVPLLHDSGFAALALAWPGVMTLYLAAAAPVLFGNRLPDPAFYVPGTRSRKNRIAFYRRLQQATGTIATATGAEFAVQELANTFGAPVVLRANDGRPVAASPAYHNPLLSLPAALLRPCRHFLLREDGDVAPALRHAMTHYGVDAILPLYPYGDGATGWLLIGAPFASLVVSSRDVRETTPLFNRVGELVLEQLVTMHKEAEQHEQRAMELNQARQRLEAENESLRRENARLLREHPADTFSLISTASQDVATPPTITLLGRDKDLLRTLRPSFPQIAHYVSPASDGFRKQRRPEVLICHIPSPDERRDKQIVRLIQDDGNNTVFLLYGDSARTLMEHHHRKMLGHIVALLPRTMAGKATAGWIHTIAQMRRAILDTGVVDCPLVGRSQVFIDLIADAVRASRFLEPVLIRGVETNEILALARFIHNKSGTGKMSVLHAQTPLRSRSGGGRHGPDEGALDEAIRKARGGTLVIEDLARIPPAELNGLVKRVFDLGDVRLIAGLALRDDATEPPLPASLKVFNLEIPPLHERRLDLPLLTLYYEVLYNLQAAAESYLNPLEIESILEPHQIDTQVALKALVFEQLEERSTNTGQTIYPEPDGARKSLDECVADFEAELIRRTLDQCGGNKSKTARLLGLRPNTLHYKMVRHGLAGNRRKLDD